MLLALGNIQAFRLESSDLPLREHLAHTVADEKIIQIDDQLTGLNMDSCLTVLSVEKGMVGSYACTFLLVFQLHLVNNIVDRTELATFTTPTGSWLTFYAPRLMICAVAESDLYSSFPFIDVSY